MPVGVQVKGIIQTIQNPVYLNFLFKLRRKMFQTITALDTGVFMSDEPIPFAEVGGLKFEPVSKGMKWGTKFACAWFAMKADLKEAAGSEEEFAKIMAAAQDGSVVSVIKFSGEGCVYNEKGEIVQGLTNIMNASDALQPVTGKRIVPLNKIGFQEDGTVKFFVDAGYNGMIMSRKPGNAAFQSAKLCFLRWDMLELYYDFLIAYQTKYNLADGKMKRQYSEALSDAMRYFKGGTESDVEKARTAIGKIYEDKDRPDFEVYAVGHAHLDLAWLWPIRETKRKSLRTLSNALYNIEKQPDYVFGVSQPQQLEWTKKADAKLFERIKKAVAEGSIELQGGMWTEPDTNVPCGESLIRQFYYGMKFYKEEFGKTVDNLWVPDVFGYSGALPQIMKKCGVNKFMTIKLSWNTVNKFPHHTFNWEGIDNSKVLVHMPPEGDYNSTAMPTVAKFVEETYRERKVSDIALMPFGAGDGGGGPGEYSVHAVDRQSRLNGAIKVKFASAAEFFERLSKDKERYPSFKGELYLEKHQGTYTTQARNKKFNRLLERLLHNAEWLCSVASIKGMEYPRAKLDEIWKEVLLYQFHDILPGSSIQRVYTESVARYAILEKETRQIIADAIEFLKGQNAAASESAAEEKDRFTTGCKESVLNPTSFKRKGFVKSCGKWYSYDAEGYSEAPLYDARIQHDLLKNDINSIENDILKVTFDEKGRVSSLVGKVDGYDYAGGVLSAPRIYTDKKMYPYDAWDINMNWHKKAPKDLVLEFYETGIDGPSVIRRNVYKYGESRIEQRISLTLGSPYVLVENAVNWQESHKMLRVDFYPKNFSDKVLCDIQFGNIQRSTKDETSVEIAQFEIAAHKWVAVADGGRGFAVINDCKYGHRVKNGLISLNCLRSTEYPDPKADLGEHTFTYALYPFKGDLFESELIKAGYEINNPVIQVSGSTGLKAVVKTDAPNIVVETVFLDDSGQVAFRAYETAGKDTAAKFEAEGFSRAVETNMLFKEGKACDLSRLVFTPYEVKTIVLEK